jgi:hypothetical protein
MKIALIQPVHVGGAHSFGWRWRAEDGASESAHAFTYFYDCCENARRKGYECQFGAQPVTTVLPATGHAVSVGAATRAARPRAR